MSSSSSPSSSSAASDGYETLLEHTTTLLTARPPPFIHIHDPGTPRVSAGLLRSHLPSLATTSQGSLRIVCASVNAVACFTPRLFYDTALNALAGWTPRWEDGCENWGDDTGQRFNENVDGFVHGLKALHAHLSSPTGAKIDGITRNEKGKERAIDEEQRKVRMALVVERAERLKENVPDLVVPLTRLAELTQLDLAVIFHSELPWDQMRPSLGASPDPFHISVLFLSKQTILSRLIAAYPSIPTASAAPSAAVHSRLVDNNLYHPALQPLYAHFVATAYSVCSPFVVDPDELAYIVAARWPGFVQPVLDEWAARKREAKEERRQLRRQSLDDDVDAEGVDDDEYTDSEGKQAEEREDIELTPPTEDTRLRLTRLFTPSITQALESLYPRLSSAQEWLQSYKPPPNLLSYHPRDAPGILAAMHTTSKASSTPHANAKEDEGVTSCLPRMAKFILVASFLASTNPAKTDARMFGRGAEERGKRRGKARRSVSPKKKGAAGTAKSPGVKIPQRLLGPLAFPLDRLLAILGILLEENDAEVRPPMPEYNSVPGSYTEAEISKVAVYAQVNNLASMHLLHRTSPDNNKLELSPSFKCGISYEVALKLAKDLDVALNDLLWDPV